MTIQRVLIEVDEYLVFLYYDEESPENKQINEAKHRGTPIGGSYSVQLHRPHTDANKDHLHVYNRNNQIFALNKDGTAHDGSHGVRIPNKVAKGIRNHFPNFQIPFGNVIESFRSLPQATQLLLRVRADEKDDLILITEG